MTDTPAFAASIFDMDGLLVDSEPLWHEAEVEILGALGVPLAAGDTRRTKGMFVGEVTRYWFERHPWAGPGPDAVAAEVVDRVGELVVAKGALQPGVHRTLEACRRRGLPLALASSTEYRLIRLVLGHFSLSEEFVVVHSAEDEPYGKPHPGVFLSTAEELGVPAGRCVVWEDAPAGVLAAKAARMACVAVPDPAEADSPAVALADAVLASLEEVDDALFERLVRSHWSDPMAAPGVHRAPGGAQASGPGGSSTLSK
ncbi:MAG TPA: hexitol phosphatase HxpB [Acidimicrobiales bacterium]|nr:hexitol phosphatase HxpB [Acidimicrobiales bacterium]